MIGSKIDTIMKRRTDTETKKSVKGTTARTPAKK